MPLRLEKTRWNSEPSRPTATTAPRAVAAPHIPRRPGGDGIEARPVERVRHLADEARRCRAEGAYRRRA